MNMSATHLRKLDSGVRQITYQFLNHIENGGLNDKGSLHKVKPPRRDWRIWASNSDTVMARSQNLFLSMYYQLFKSRLFLPQSYEYEVVKYSSLIHYTLILVHSGWPLSYYG